MQPRKKQRKAILIKSVESRQNSRKKGTDREKRSKSGDWIGPINFERQRTPLKQERDEKGAKKGIRFSAVFPFLEMEPFFLGRDQSTRETVEKPVVSKLFFL